MYDYISVRIDFKPCSPDVTDLTAAFLADEGFETFEPDENGVTAYIRKDKYEKGVVEKIMESFPIDCEYNVVVKEIEGEDWNKEWEQNYFQPIKIDDKLLIRSSFHKVEENLPIEIIIDPKMAFGTGHHSTTAGMSRMLLEEDLEGKTVIDMGTGTGILSILAKKKGSGHTIGIDIDKFAVENARENALLNNVDIDWIEGDDKVLSELQSADIFLANINLNVIKENLGSYVSRTKPHGKVFLSGFLSEDKAAILREAEKYSLKLVRESEENNWVTIVFEVY